jgi:acyl-CoA thioesterase FadM
MWFYVAFGILLVIAFFDLYWFLRLILTWLLSMVLPAINLADERVTYNICWTIGLVNFAYMNNSKYFREMDFGRLDFYFRTGCSAYIEARPGIHVVQHGATVRYRRSIDAFVPFKLVTKLIFWDERSLNFEQSFVSLHDGFVCAVALCKNTVVRGSTESMLGNLGAAGPGPVPREVELWEACQIREALGGRKK